MVGEYIPDCGDSLLRRIFYRLGLLDEQDMADERNRSTEVYPIAGAVDPLTGVPFPGSEEFVVVPRRDGK